MIAAGRRGRVLAVGATVIVLAVVAVLVGRAVGGSDEPGASGFPEVAFRITTADGQVRDWCALLAATVAARNRGLMGQRDLQGYDGMVFRFDRPTESAFYMYRTELPLSIAWFDEAGRFVSARDMAPCPADDPAACPTFGATAPYLHALEVEQGDLAGLGVAAGSTLSFPGGSCA